MAISKAAQTIFPQATNVAAGTTKAAPVIGSSVDTRLIYGADITYKITNSTGTFTAACNITFQISHDNTNWYDLYTVTSDTVASSVNSGVIQLDRPVMYVRAIAYGVTGSGVSALVEVFLQTMTGV